MNAIYTLKKSFFTLFFISILGGVNAQIIPTPLSPTLDLATIQNEVYWRTDSTQNWTIDSVKELTFQAFDFSKRIPFNPYHAFWFKFRLKNESATDSLKALLCTDHYSNTTLFPIKENIKPLRGGEYLSVRNRAFKPNELCFPIIIPANDSQSYFLRIYDFSKKKKVSFSLIIKSYDQEKIERNLLHSERLPNYIFFGIYSGTLFILFFYAAFQYRATFDKAFLFYACYLVSIYVYNLKNFESETSWPFPILFSYFMEFQRVLETNLEHLSYILYILFIQYFLDLKKESPKINHYLTISIWFLAGYILFDYFLQITLGTRTSLTIQRYVRSLFFIPAFVLVYHIFFQQKNILYRYVFVGICLLLFSSFFTLLGQLFPFEKHFYFGGTIKAYEYQGYWLYWYQMKVGLLLEMICFAFGLSYKSSQQKENYQVLNKKITSQNLQIEKITFNPTENGSSEDLWLQEVVEVLAEKFADSSFGTKELATKLNMSRSKLFRQLKDRNQPPPSIYIRQFRLEKARNLILTTDLSISEISYLTGFNEPTYFSKVFKEMYQISPSDLRSQQ